MVMSYVCARGHQWDAKDPEILPATCPLCGSLGEPSHATATQGIATEEVPPITPTGAATLPENGPEQTPPLPQLPGYEVLRVLGKGGMGLVILARHQRLGRLVAIKLPLYNLADDGRARFLREARAAAGLRHPNICTLYEVGEHEGRPYLVMDYIDGPSLRDWIGQSPTARRSAEVVALLARAVAHAHDRGVIHRDLKPGNVLVERATGHPVLMDFGLAKVLDEAGDQLSQSGTVQGTPAYMSPEQAAGRSGEIGPPSDLYSLGAILYELLTGRPPYTGGVGEVLRQVQTEDPLPPRRINPRVHPDLETVCLTAMARDPGHRYVSALVLAEDLERFAAGEPILARRAGRFRRLLRWVRRHPIPTATAGAGLLAVVLALGLAVALLSHLRQGQEREDLRAAFDAGLERPEATEAYFQRMEGYLEGMRRLAPKQVPELRERMVQRVAGSIRSDLDEPRLTPEAEERIRASLAVLSARAPESAATLQRHFQERQSGWRLLIDLRPPFADWQKVFRDSLQPRPGRLIRPEIAEGGQGRLVCIREDCRGPVRLEAIFGPTWSHASGVGLVLNYVEGPADEVLRLAISPDGQSVLAACGYAGLPGTNVCELATGRVRYTLPAPGPNYASAFSPGGRRIVTAGPRGSIRLWDLPDGREIAAVPAHDAVVRGLTFAPDGHTLASCSEDGSIRIWEVEGDGNALTPRATMTHGQGRHPVSDIAFAPGGRVLASAGSGQIHIWDLTTRRVVQTLKGHTGMVHRLAFNGTAGEAALASAGQDGTVRLWQRGTYRELGALQGAAGDAYDVTFAPDGKTLAAAYAGKCVKLWDLTTHRERLSLTNFADRVTAVAFTPDGRSVVTGDVANTVRRWDTISGREQWSLERSDGYAFALRLPEAPTSGDKRAQPSTLAEALAQGKPLRVQILRNGRLQRERSALLAPDAPLHLRASREGNRLAFQVNDLPPLEFQDVFPLGTTSPGVFALEWPAGVGLEQLRADRRTPPARPSLLEQGDEAYARGDFASAADCYARQVQAVANAGISQEAVYKRALCLIALKQPEEALTSLGQLARGVTEDSRNRWGLLAACRLWLYHLTQHQLDQADEVFRLLETHYRFEQLAALISDELRGQILEAYRSGNPGQLLIRKDPRHARQLRRVLDVENLFQEPWGRRVATAHFLCIRHLLNDETDQAALTAEELLRNPGLPAELVATPASDLVWALRRRGEVGRALGELNRRLTATAGRYPPAVLPLLLERARLRATRREWMAAEKDIAAFLQQLLPAQWRNAAPLLAQAHLIRGFLREQQDDAEGAQAAWRQALGLLKRTPAVVTCEGFVLCSLTGDLTESDAAYFIEQSTGRLGIPAANYIRKGGIVEPRWLASVMREAWRNPRGRDYARRITFHDLSVMDCYGIQFALFVAEAFRQGAMAGRQSAEQEALIWGVSEGVYRSYTRNEFSEAQAFLGLTAWTGATGFLGWGGLSASLQSRPDLRGPLAYLYGQHYLRLGKRPDARTLFQAALRDAGPDSPLHRLAQEELNHKPADQ